MKKEVKSLNKGVKAIAFRTVTMKKLGVKPPLLTAALCRVDWPASFPSECPFIPDWCLKRLPFVLQRASG